MNEKENDSSFCRPECRKSEDFLYDETRRDEEEEKEEKEEREKEKERKRKRSAGATERVSKRVRERQVIEVTPGCRFFRPSLTARRVK